MQRFSEGGGEEFIASLLCLRQPSVLVLLALILLDTALMNSWSPLLLNPLEEACKAFI